MVIVFPSITKALHKIEAGKVVCKLVLVADYWSCVHALLNIFAQFCARIIEMETNIPRLSKMYMAYIRLRDTIVKNIAPPELQTVVLEKINSR